MSKLLSSLLAAGSILSGCATGPQPMLAPRLIPPASLTTLDDPPPPPASGSLPDLYANHLQAMHLYWRMRASYQGLIEWLEATDEVRRRP